jgi:hypothetical protein
VVGSVEQAAEAAARRRETGERILKAPRAYHPFLSVAEETGACRSDTDAGLRDVKREDESMLQAAKRDEAV